MDTSLDGLESAMESAEQNSLEVSMKSPQVQQAMLPDGNGSLVEPVNQSSTEVPVEVHQFVQELVNNAEAIQKKIARSKKEISLLKKKCEKVQEYENLNQKHKREMLKLFSSNLKKRTSKSTTKCKSCPSQQSDLKTVKRRLRELLEQQTNKEERVWDIKQDIRRKKVTEEFKIHKTKEFKQKCQERKADDSKHFFRSKFEAYCLRHKIKYGFGNLIREERVSAVQKSATESIINAAFVKVPEKILEFEKECLFEAMEEVETEIGKRDNIDSTVQQRASSPISAHLECFFEEAFICRRERSMRLISHPNEPKFMGW